MEKQPLPRATIEVLGVLIFQGIISVYSMTWWLKLIIMSILGISAIVVVNRIPRTVSLSWRYKVIISILTFVIWIPISWYPIQDQWIKDHPQKQITPPPMPPSLSGNDVSREESTVTPLPPPIKQVQKSESKTKDRPYFSIYGSGLTIMTNPKSQMKIDINNTGKHAAINLYYRFIITNNQFRGEKMIGADSSANEYPPNIPHFVFTDIPLPQDVAPLYVVFAIRYQDKEVQFKKASSYYYQTWYYKTNDAWIGTTKGIQPPRVLNATFEEKETIFSNLKPWLENYRK